MLTGNPVTYSLRIIWEMLWDVIKFPFWWYSSGLVWVVESLIKLIKNKEKAWALLIWVKNIFKPMYAVTDWQGKLISFFMRVIQIIVRSVIMLFWVFVAIGLLFVWLVLPTLVIYQIIFQLYV